MNDITKLADRIERKDLLTLEEWDRVVAALRRSQPEGMVMVPKGVIEDIYALAACDNHCGSNDCPFCSIGNEIRGLLSAAEAEGRKG